MPAAAVPLSTPVPALNVMPDGNVPVSDNVGLGKPLAVTVKDSETPMEKVAAFALVTAAA